MKKRIIFALCAVTALSLAACGGEAVTAQKAAAEETVQIPNPFIDCETLDEAAGIA